MNDGKCIDVDECATSTHDCDKNSDCKNVDGGFECSCKEGFLGNGYSCFDIDECDLDLSDCHQGKGFESCAETKFLDQSF